MKWTLAHVAGLLLWKFHRPLIRIVEEIIRGDVKPEPIPVLVMQLLFVSVSSGEIVIPGASAVRHPRTPIHLSGRNRVIRLRKSRSAIHFNSPSRNTVHD
jgi:hypothetical protein